MDAPTDIAYARLISQADAAGDVYAHAAHRQLHPPEPTIGDGFPATHPVTQSPGNVCWRLFQPR